MVCRYLSKALLNWAQRSVYTRQCNMSDIDLMILSTWYPSSPGSPRSPCSPRGPCVDECTHLNTHAKYTCLYFHPQTFSWAQQQLDCAFVFTGGQNKTNCTLDLTSALLESNRKAKFHIEPHFQLILLCVKRRETLRPLYCSQNSMKSNNVPT